MSDGRTPRLRSRERSQSEVLGYALLLSIILVSLTVTVVAGLTALGDVQSASVTENSETAMRSVAGDFEAVARGTAQTRTSELTLRSGSLEVGPETMVNVTAKAGGRKVAINRTFRPLIYSTDDAEIVYENGLLIRDQRDGAVALNDPLLTASNRHTVVLVVETWPTAEVSLGGGTRQIKIRNAGTDGISLSRSGSGIDVNVTVQTVSDRADVWGRVLDAMLPESGGSDPCQRLRASTVACDFTTDRVTISSVNATYEFE